MSPLNLDVEKTALVVIDMQNGILSLPCAPYPAKSILAQTIRLADAFRTIGGFVVLVNVDSRDGKDVLRPITDQPVPTNPPARSEDYAQFPVELGPKRSDHLLTKHQWGAFFGTDLDLQLRRRGIDTIVLCGIATNIGVETTAREAFQYGYQQIFVEDAMTALSVEQHEHTLQYIFPRIGRVRNVNEVISAISRSENEVGF